jgi:hypothetical protein
MSWPSVPLKAEKGMLIFFHSEPAVKVCCAGMRPPLAVKNSTR